LDEEGPLAGRRLGASYIFPAVGHFETHQSGTNMRVTRKEKWGQQHLRQGTRNFLNTPTWEAHVEEDRKIGAFTRPNRPLVWSPLGGCFDSDVPWTIFRTHPIPNQENLGTARIVEGLRSTSVSEWSAQPQSEEPWPRTGTRRAKRASRREVGMWNRRNFQPYMDYDFEPRFDAAPFQPQESPVTHDEGRVLMWNDRAYVMPRQGVCDAVYRATQDLAKRGIKVRHAGTAAASSSASMPSSSKRRRK